MSEVIRDHVFKEDEQHLIDIFDIQVQTPNIIILHFNKFHSFLKLLHCVYT